MADVLTLGAHRQILVDDHVVSESRGLTTTLHQPTKYAGNPILSSLCPWEGYSVNVWGTVRREPDTGLFQMWYQISGRTPQVRLKSRSRHWSLIRRGGL